MPEASETILTPPATTPTDTVAPASGTDTIAPAPGTDTTSPTAGADKPADKADDKGNDPPDKAAQPSATDLSGLKLPDDVTVDAKTFDEFKALATELKLPNLSAQKLLDMHVALQRQAAESWATQATGWVDAVKTDKELGGAKFDETKANAARAMTQFGSPELRKLLVETGLGNHPEMVRAFARIGREHADDTLVTGHLGAVSEMDRYKAMFPNSPQMFDWH